MKKISAIITLCLIVLTACGSGGLYGNYAAENHESTMQFDGERFMLVVPAFVDTLGDSTSQLILGGTYDLNGGKLTLNFDEAVTREKVLPVVLTLLAENGVDEPVQEQIDDAMEHYLTDSPYLGSYTLDYNTKKECFTFNAQKFTKSGEK